jgi:hypothetical protein
LKKIKKKRRKMNAVLFGGRFFSHITSIHNRIFRFRPRECGVVCAAGNWNFVKFCKERKFGRKKERKYKQKMPDVGKRKTKNKKSKNVPASANTWAR